MFNKPIVHYKGTAIFIGIENSGGFQAIVQPIDHPDTENVSNETTVLTSPIVSSVSNGEFETLYTKYIPINHLA